MPERPSQFRYFQSIFPGKKEIFGWFWQIFLAAITHLSYTEGIPGTTALIENINGQIKARIKTIKGRNQKRVCMTSEDTLLSA